VVPRFPPAATSLSTAVVPSYLAPSDFTQINNGAGTVNFAVNMRLWQTASLKNTSAPVEATGNNPTGYPQKVMMLATFLDGTSNTLLFATRYMICSGSQVYISGGTPTVPGYGGAAQPHMPVFGWNYANGITYASSGPASTTGYIATSSSNFSWQAAPSTTDCGTASGAGGATWIAQSFYPQALQVALCDASVRSISASVSQWTFTAALTPNGNEVMQVDWVE
jgi:hypothetical protein